MSHLCVDNVAEPDILSLEASVPVACLSTMVGLEEKKSNNHSQSAGFPSYILLSVCFRAETSPQSTGDSVRGLPGDRRTEALNRAISSSESCIRLRLLARSNTAPTRSSQPSRKEGGKTRVFKTETSDLVHFFF